jgi:hypothetical protein
MERTNISDFIALLEANTEPQKVLDILDLCPCFVDRVKIKTDNWGSSSALNFHAAQYMQAVQKDVLAAWNMATGQNVTMSQLDKFPFLIVNFDVQDGCLNIQQAIKLAGLLVKDLSPKQKMLLYAMLFGGVLAVCTAYSVGKLADSGFFDSEDVKKVKVMAQQKESAKVIINNLGNGTVFYQGQDWSAEALRSDKKKIENVSATENVALDGTYTIDTCKLEGGIHIIGQNSKQFNADVESLDEEKRQILSARLGEALIQKKKLDQLFRVDAQVKDGNIIKAHIIDIDQPPRQHATAEPPTRPIMTQGNLLSFD